MKTRVRRLSGFAALVIGWLSAGASMAEGPNVWDGPYLGAQLGGAANGSCSRWILPGTAVDAADQLISKECAGGRAVVGVQIGENFQHEHAFWGLAADVNFASGNKSTQSWTSDGPVPEAGTYLTSERLSPYGLLILAPRVGYAGRNWAPYLRAGGLVAFGARDSSLSYTPSGATLPAASFTGAKAFDTFGWVAGGGIEWGLYGPWSIGFEYLHASLGKGSSASAGCVGTAAACGAFSGIAFENLHDAFTFNTFRIGVNYYFDFW
jgi:opacity protein-like surface antigen